MPVYAFPAMPDLPDTHTTRAQGWLRYEDVSQDGRMMLLALPHTIGLAVWANLLSHSPIAGAAARAGITTVLTKLVIEGTEGPVSVRKPLDVTGGYQLAHTVDDAGAVNRIVMNLWTGVSAPRARSHGPPPAGAGEIVRVGRVFGEHVFTRLFAPPTQRKVLRLDLPGMVPVPEERYSWTPPTELVELPMGATPLDDALTPDPAPLSFGLTHSDSNQHVNSLAYPRLFEEAALRRFAAHGRSTKVLSRFVEVGYRKPSFAGDRMTILLRAFELGGMLGAVGAFVPAGGDPAVKASPHCTVRMHFEP